MNQLEQYVHQNFQESYEEVSNSQRAHVLPMLTLEEKTIIYEYTSWEYLTVNSALRESKGITVSKFAQYLDTVLSKLPNYKGRAVHRGAESNEHLLSLYQQSYDYKIPVTEHGFLSASRSPIIAQTLFQGDLLFEILQKRGKLIEDIAKNGTFAYESEEEVLFRKNTQFKVLDISKTSRNILISLKEI